DVIESSEIQKVEKILELQIPVIKNKVFTKKGEYLGKALDYSMDPKMFVLTSIVVAKSFLGILQWDRRIIGYKDIIEIKKDAIIVANNFGMAPVKKFGVVTPVA
ncbi:PRC-barrel domain-containing protein, partial [Pseudomonadota bacterium]